MKKAQKNNESDTVCAVDYAFQRIGGKHKGRVIYHLRAGVKRYGELRRSLTGITPKMLTQVLRELEQDELITRHVYLEVPPRVEYQLTDTGRELLPFIILLSEWGRKQMGMPSLYACQPALSSLVIETRE
ncbi:helix-turn-helix transcriptional regulator [Chitinophaga polysaccharea]|uniref:winged helix-turn-helix transcriptional regulator n=1 Tax=Chitinophaga TaxID=79328 RepID=UPI001455A0CB|nr:MULTISPECIES: helix-turn-helix domain-containing protein [Chitinophaga]NLR61612.1 helix-turn-helix transcriptional regulator [Chitinophaga polysaccharea]NLU93793.1 helix-turn-helix transcriptional regulator [Chitinophaga sp. Ak27]